MKRQQEDAMERCNKFNIRRIDGIDYVVYGNTIVSRPDETDVLGHLDFIRRSIIAGKPAV